MILDKINLQYIKNNVLYSDYYNKINKLKVFYNNFYRYLKWKKKHIYRKQQ